MDVCVSSWAICSSRDDEDDAYVVVELGEEVAEDVEDAVDVEVEEEEKMGVFPSFLA